MVDGAFKAMEICIHAHTGCGEDLDRKRICVKATPKRLKRVTSRIPAGKQTKNSYGVCMWCVCVCDVPSDEKQATVPERKGTPPKCPSTQVRLCLR